MSGWVKIPDNWLEGDDIERLGSDAVLLHLSALSYSCRQGSDGRLPDGALRRLWPVDDLDATIKMLSTAGEWERTDSGWFLVNWAVHLLAHSEVEHRREVSRETSERYRRHKAGDHSMCERCSFVKASRDVSRDTSLTTSVTSLVSPRLDSSRNVVRETRREEDADARHGSAGATPTGDLRADSAAWERSRLNHGENELAHEFQPSDTAVGCGYTFADRTTAQAYVCGELEDDICHEHPYEPTDWNQPDITLECQFCDLAQNHAVHPNRVRVLTR